MFLGVKKLPLPHPPVIVGETSFMDYVLEGGTYMQETFLFVMKTILRNTEITFNLTSLVDVSLALTHIPL